MRVSAAQLDPTAASDRGEAAVSPESRRDQGSERAVNDKHLDRSILTGENHGKVLFRLDIRRASGRFGRHLHDYALSLFGSKRSYSFFTTP
jgi:hypothetical protein